jgi:hypothetical protein
VFQKKAIEKEKHCSEEENKRGNKRKEMPGGEG